jgi:hypothetical protein
MLVENINHFNPFGQIFKYQLVVLYILMMTIQFEGIQI